MNAAAGRAKPPSLPQCVRLGLGESSPSHGTVTTQAGTGTQAASHWHRDCQCLSLRLRATVTVRRPGRRLRLQGFNLKLHNPTAGSCCGPKKLEAGHGAGRSQISVPRAGGPGAAVPVPPAPPAQPPGRTAGGPAGGRGRLSGGGPAAHVSG